MLSRLARWAHALIRMPVTVAHMHERQKIAQEQLAVAVSRILHRIDALSNDELHPIRTLCQRGEVDSISQRREPSFSQYRDDVVISAIFEKLGVTEVYYVDVGAHHPTHFSNTARFYDAGGSGINIEPNPVLYSRFKDDRPRDTNLNMGIASAPGVLKFHLIAGDPTLSTFDDEQLSRLVASGHRRQASIDVPVDTLTRIIDVYAPGRRIDLLSIDVEGMDFAVLQSLDLHQHRPQVIEVEINEYGSLMTLPPICPRS